MDIEDVERLNKAPNSQLMFSIFLIEPQRDVITNSRFWSGKKFHRRSLTIVKFGSCIATENYRAEKNACLQASFGSSNTTLRRRPWYIFLGEREEPQYSR